MPNIKPFIGRYPINYLYINHLTLGSGEPPYHDLLPPDGSVLDQLETGYLALRDLLLPALKEYDHLANGNTASVRGIAYHIAGHELHHKGLLQQFYLRH